MKTTNLTTYNLLGMFPKGVVLNKKAGYKKSTIYIRIKIYGLKVNLLEMTV